METMVWFRSMQSGQSLKPVVFSFRSISLHREKTQIIFATIIWTYPKYIVYTNEAMEEKKHRFNKPGDRYLEDKHTMFAVIVFRHLVLIFDSKHAK